MAPPRLLLRTVMGSRSAHVLLRSASLEPPRPTPPAHMVTVPGRGEFFLRDSGGDGPAVMLLHGWTASADLNWLYAYGPLIEAGYRVLAIDHRGHGRGLRSHAPFRLTDCADDVAAVIDTLACGPLLLAGYSMGGPISQLLARSRPDLVRGMVLCATTREWQGPRFRRLWRRMWVLRLVLTAAPLGFWTFGTRFAGMTGDDSAWLTGELSRNSALALAEAGRELGRFDSRPWLGDVKVPAAVVLTKRDRAVPPRRQRELAEALGAEIFEVDGDHFVSGWPDGRFNVALLAALAHIDA